MNAVRQRWFRFMVGSGLGCLALVLVIPASLEAWGGPRYEVALQIVGMGWQGNPFSDDPADHPQFTTGGWPLTLKLKAAKDFLGFGAASLGNPYPSGGGFVREGDNGYTAWVFGDASAPYGVDNCPSWDGLANPLEWPGCELSDPDYSDPSTWWPIDETVVPYGQGLTTPGLCSNSCDASDTACVPCEERPQIATHSCTWEDDLDPYTDGICGFETDTGSPIYCPCQAAPGLWTFGPNLGTDSDGYGYGYNPRLPGLVIVADAGMSIVTVNDPVDERPVRTSPLQCRNLAGFVQSTTQVLSDARYKTHLVAHMNLPVGLLTPVVLTDADHENVGGVWVGSCEYGNDSLNDDTLVVIDGKDPECRQGSVAGLNQILSDYLITLRVFVAQVDEEGKGVDVIEDLNGNGYCDAEDFELMVSPDWDWNRGDPVLSRQASLSFTLLAGPLEFAATNDLDGDGNLFLPVLPGGSGGLVGPPR